MFHLSKLSKECHKLFCWPVNIGVCVCIYTSSKKLPSLPPPPFLLHCIMGGQGAGACRDHLFQDSVLLYVSVFRRTMLETSFQLCNVRTQLESEKLLLARWLRWGCKVHKVFVHTKLKPIKPLYSVGKWWPSVLIDPVLAVLHPIYSALH